MLVLILSTNTYNISIATPFISERQYVEGMNAAKSYPSNVESTAKSSGKIGNENYVVDHFVCMEKYELESFLDTKIFENTQTS